MDIAIASDHAGYQYKEAIKAFLADRGHQPIDFGAFSEDAADYPVFIRAAAEAVAARRCEQGIVLGGSGNGEAMVANRVAGVRCALCWSHESAEMGRRHNNANVISIGQRMVTREVALDIVAAWLDTSFDGGRHARRIRQIDGAAVITTDAPDGVSPLSHVRITLTVTDDEDSLVDALPVSITQVEGKGAVTAGEVTTTKDGRTSFDYLAPREGNAVLLVRVNPDTPSEVSHIIEMDVVPESRGPWPRDLAKGWQRIRWRGDSTPVADVLPGSEVSAIYGWSAADGWSFHFKEHDAPGVNTLAELIDGSVYFVYVANSSIKPVGST